MSYERHRPAFTDMKLWKLRYVWLVTAAVGLGACATQTTQDDLRNSTSTTTAAVTIVDDNFGPTTSVANIVPSSVPSAKTSASKLRPTSLPGPNLNQPAGVYGWTGDPGSRGWLHRVWVDGRGLSSQTQLVFTVEDVCFARSPGAEPTMATVAGLDGLYLEPHDDDSVYLSVSPNHGETTGAYALPIDDRTLCVYLTWDRATIPDELTAAREVVESIRGEPHGEDGIRINFTLPCCWDTG
jgi:hypothetical protein